MTGDQGQREIGHPPRTAPGPSLAERIRDLHRVRPAPNAWTEDRCYHCDGRWPCPTIRVVNAHEKGTDR